MLTLSAILPSLIGSDCEEANTVAACSPPPLEEILFFFSLYLAGISESGHKPCTQAFGADQFNSDDFEESKAKSSFFNWWYFGVCAGALVAISVVTYVQDNLSWALGFGIPCVAMVFALLVFLLGTRTYRYSVTRSEKGPFLRIGRVFVAAFKNWRSTLSSIDDEEDSCLFANFHDSNQFK